MKLEGEYILQIELVGRAGEETAKLGNGMYIRSLRRRRDLRHVPTLELREPQGDLTGAQESAEGDV